MARSALTHFLGAVLVAVIGAHSCLAFAQSATPTSKPAGRYVAIPPPSAGENTYGNFLWVLDTATGNVVAHRIASVKDANGKYDGYITERLWTEEEYASIRRAQNK